MLVTVVGSDVTEAPAPPGLPEGAVELSLLAAIWTLLTLDVDRDDVVTLALLGSLLGLDVCAGIAFGWLVALAGFFTLAAIWSAFLLGLPRRRR